MYIVLAGPEGSIQVVLETSDWLEAKAEAKSQTEADMFNVVIVLSTMTAPSQVHWQTE